MGCPGCTCGEHDEVGTQVGEEFVGQSLPFSTGGNTSTVTWSVNTLKEQSLPEQLEQMISVAEELTSRLESILGKGEPTLNANAESDAYGLVEKVKKLDKLLARANAQSLEIYSKVGVL